MNKIKVLALVIIILELFACSRKNAQRQNIDIVEQKDIDIIDASSENSFYFYDKKIKQMIMDYYKNDLYSRQYMTNKYNIYELIEIRKIDIGIWDTDCYITIWNLIGDDLAGYIIHNYYFFGLRDNKIIIGENLKTGYLQTPFVNFEGYNYPKKLTDFLDNIQLNYIRIGNDFAFIGDINCNGDDDIIIFAYPVEYSPPDINIWGVSKNCDNIAQYLETFFNFPDNNIPIIFDNRNITIYKQDVSPFFSYYMWNDYQEKYYVNHVQEDIWYYITYVQENITSKDNAEKIINDNTKLYNFIKNNFFTSIDFGGDYWNYQLTFVIYDTDKDFIKFPNEFNYAIIPAAPPFLPWVTGSYEFKNGKVVLYPTDVFEYYSPNEIFKRKMELEYTKIKNSSSYTEGLKGEGIIFGAKPRY